MTRLLLTVLLLSCPLYAQNAIAPPHGYNPATGDNTRLTQSQFAAVAHSCGGSVPAETLAAIAHTESAFHPFALSINYPQSSARKAGFANGNMLLERQPDNIREAVTWAKWFEDHGYTVSVGLMQINTKTARVFHVKTSELFEVCSNVRIGSKVLAYYYHAAHTGGKTRSQALLDAISAYNSGNLTMGYDNGYVGTVVANGHKGEK